MRIRRSTFVMLVTAGLLASTPTAAHADFSGSGSVAPLPPGNAQSEAGVTTEPGSGLVPTVVLGTDGQLWAGFLGQPTWTPLHPLAVGIKGAPSIVSWSDGRRDVFVRGGDDKLWQTTTFFAGGDFQNWIKPVGDDGVLAGSPKATVLRPGRLDVFVKGTDGQVYQRFWNDASWNNSWIPLGSPAPAATIVGDVAPLWGRPTAVNRLDLFVQGSDGKLWQDNWNGASWSGWARPLGTNGTLTSTPAVTLFDRGGTSASQSNIGVFVRGADGGYWGIDFTSTGWGSWVRFGTASDVFVDGPAATFVLPRRILIEGRQANNQVYRITFDQAATFP